MSKFQDAIKRINDRFGQASIQRMDDDAIVPIDRIPSGSIMLDAALGGGIPRGRIIEIFGPESSGKTTLCLHIVAEAQKLNIHSVCTYIDVEHALDPTYARQVGVDLSRIWLSQPNSGEEALEIAEEIVRSGESPVIVIDSVAALVPMKEIEGEMGDSVMGVQARLMSQAMRKLSGVTKQTNTTLIFTNQLRMKIGVMFGNPETTPGGLALRFYATQRLDIRRTDPIKHGNDVVGTRTRVKVVKNKVAAPFKVAEFDIIYGEGISKSSEVLDLGVAAGLITKRSAFYYLDDERIAQGRDKAKEYLNNNPDTMRELELKIKGLNLQQLSKQVGDDV